MMCKNTLFLRFLKITILAALLAVSCRRAVPSPEGGMAYARWFTLTPGGDVVLLSPDGGSDTIRVCAPMERLVCMSTSYIGFLEAIGAEDAVAAVSGLDFVGNGTVRDRAVDVGYDAALDYEAILRLQPDLFLTYIVSAAEPPYLAKLRELGIPVAVIREHLESHPLARAEYVKLFGALTGRQAQADSVFREVSLRYDSLRVTDRKVKVLVNIPYRDQWYIPGGDNYMTRLIADAGGEVLGAVPGQVSSSVISVEKAYAFAQEADIWLNPGWCRTRSQLAGVHPLFSSFPVLEKEVWNNTLQTTPGGGNLFWESGPVRPDLILDDLVRIISGQRGPMNYFVEVE